MGRQSNTFLGLYQRAWRWRGLGLLILVAVLFYAVFIYRTAFKINGATFFTLIDDSMISMRYARNLAEGHGLVWNVGEAPIEGFTNLGWTLYMALAHQFGIAESKLSLFIMLTSVVILVGNLVVGFQLSRVLNPSASLAPAMSAIACAFYFPLVFWSLRGMEVGLVTLLVYALALVAITSPASPGPRRGLALGSIAFLALLVRYDSILQVSVILAFWAVAKARHTRDAASLLPAAALYGLGALGIPIFQHVYFGSALPNTYYLKVIGVTLSERLSVGIQTLSQFAARDFLAPLAVALLGAFTSRRLRTPAHLLLFALFALQCGYSIYVGGDYAEPLRVFDPVGGANRFVAQGMPSLIILVALTLDYVLGLLETAADPERRPGPAQAALKTVLVGLAIVMVMSGADWLKWTLYNAPFLDSDISRARLGIQLRTYTDDAVIIAVHAAGQIPYYSHRRTIDLLGKSDPVIARGLPAGPFVPGHNKWNYDYSIMTLKPDLIADEWGHLAAYMSDKKDYYRLANGIWVRSDSTHIGFEDLAK